MAGCAPGSGGKTAPDSTRLTADGEHVISSVPRPSIAPCLPAQGRATDAAVILAPGGGHRELWVDHEGYNVAKWLSEHGVAAFVLKYGLAREDGSTYAVEGDALRDIGRAIRLVRSRAAVWGIDPARVGVMGFSAGGEVAALAAARYDAGIAEATDAVEPESSKPAFEALIDPGLPHDFKVSKDTPPAFPACGEDDRPDLSQGLAELCLALRRNGVSAELHVYTGVGQRFGLRARNTGAIAGWPGRFLEWMEARGLLNHTGRAFPLRSAGVRTAAARIAGPMAVQAGKSHNGRHPLSILRSPDFRSKALRTPRELRASCRRAAFRAVPRNDFSPS